MRTVLDRCGATYDVRHVVAFVVVAIVALALCSPSAAFALVAALAALAAFPAMWESTPKKSRFAHGARIAAAGCARCAQPAAKAPAPPAPGRSDMPIPVGPGDWYKWEDDVPYPGAVSARDLASAAGATDPAWDGGADRDADAEARGEERWGADDTWGPDGDGMPWTAGRVAQGRGAPACYDDEANAEIDGDEMLAMNSTARNDAVRVTAGTMNRLRDLDKYFREEVEERESDVWWGRHEV